MDLDVVRWRVSEEDPIASLPQHNQDIITYLEQHPQSSPKQIAEALGVPRSTMRTRLQALEKEGLIHGDGVSTNRKYSLYPLLLEDKRSRKPIRQRRSRPRTDRQADRSEYKGRP